MDYRQTCRGYEISHPYPYPYPQIFPWISMDISISIDAYHVYIATKFRQSTAGAKGVHPPKTKTKTFP